MKSNTNKQEAEWIWSMFLPVRMFLQHLSRPAERVPMMEWCGTYRNVDWKVPSKCYKVFRFPNYFWCPLDWWRIRDYSVLTHNDDQYHGVNCCVTQTLWSWLKWHTWEEVKYRFTSVCIGLWGHLYGVLRVETGFGWADKSWDGIALPTRPCIFSSSGAEKYFSGQLVAKSIWSFDYPGKSPELWYRSRVSGWIRGNVGQSAMKTPQSPSPLVDGWDWWEEKANDSSRGLVWLYIFKSFVKALPNTKSIFLPLVNAPCEGMGISARLNR